MNDIWSMWGLGEKNNADENHERRDPYKLYDSRKTYPTDHHGQVFAANGLVRSSGRMALIARIGNAGTWQTDRIANSSCGQIGREAPASK